MNHLTDADRSQEATAAETMAAQLTAHIDRNADLVQEFLDIGEDDLARAFADMSLAWRMVADALANDGDVEQALGRVDEANARGRVALANARAK